MSEFLHKNLAKGRWFELSLMEQVGNIGSEVGRAISYHQKNEKDSEEKALERALDLFDLTISDARWRRRLKEITRAREVLCSIFYGNNPYNVSLEELDKYFYEFAYAARLNK